MEKEMKTAIIEEDGADWKPETLNALAF